MARPETFHDHTGVVRRLGLAPSFGGLLSLPRYGDASTLVPESEWREFDVWPSAVKIKDQGQTNFCVEHSGSTALELTRFGQGYGYTELDPWSLAAVITGGVDEGASISGLLKVLEQLGAAPAGTLPHGVYDPKRLPANFKQLAAPYKVELAASVSSPEEIMSAVQRRNPLVLSIRVGGGFDSLDSEGVTRPGRLGPDNHAVCCYGGARKSPKWGWVVRCVNSWGPAWGLNGFFWAPLDSLARKSSFEGVLLKAAAPPVGGVAA